ncbi:MAG: hypothetical protein IT431_04495 [Phycisphaerales bacterium]|nr:hypothetical protein [Phycisphaerales bacterium]
MASHTSRLLRSLALAGAVFAASCGPTSLYRPFYDEGGSGASIDEFTYVSTSESPKTVTVVDTRTQETVFALDIPVGQQLVLNFDDKSADRDKYMSGTMRWGVMSAGDRFGSKRNRVDVPPAGSRRIDLTVREGPEVATPPTVETMTPPPLGEEG